MAGARQLGWGMIAGRKRRLSSPPGLPTTQAPTRQVNATFFSDRSPVIDAASSALIVGGLQQIGLLGPDGWLVADPKLFDVRDWEALPGCLIGGTRPWADARPGGAQAHAGRCARSSPAAL